MKKYFIFITLIFVFYFSFIPPIKAALLLDISINEIAWMGSKSSSNDEWIELYNNTDKNISLDGWILKSQAGKLNIKLKSEIKTHDFYLMERTDDNSIPGIKADLIYSGSLSNNGADLKLYDNSANLIDQANCSAGWFAGNNITKQTMEKINSAIVGTEKSNWQTSQNPDGTPKAKNSIGINANTPTVIPTKAGIQDNSTSDQKIIYPNNIFINEILPSPQGADETEEWIELYNQNSFEVDLSGWKLKDTEGTITTYIIPATTKIPAESFLIFKRPETKINLNNTGDTINLLFPDDKITSIAYYTKAPLGQSYNLVNSNWNWSTTLTPLVKNIITLPALKATILKSKTSKTTLPKNQNSDNNNSVIAESLADISKPLIENPNNQNPWFLFFIAITITIISAILVLIIKTKFIKNIK